MPHKYTVRDEHDRSIAHADSHGAAFTFAKMYSVGTSDRTSCAVWIYEYSDTGDEQVEKTIAYVHCGVVYNREN